MSHLLVVDWDFFFPNPMDGGEHQDRPDVLLYDWQKAETLTHINTVWEGRANGFQVNGLPLPMAEGYEGFWDRFSFGPEALLEVADSNRHAGTGWAAEDPFESVWLFDAHHDCGYTVRSQEQFDRAETYSCEDWMLRHSAVGTALHVRYPHWKVHAFDAETAPAVEVDRQYDDRDEALPVFDHVFLCRSGAWVPAWCDDQFVEFFESFPGEVDIIEDTEELPLHRNFDVAKAQEIVDAMKLMRERYSSEHVEFNDALRTLIPGGNA